jgi:hypothetical protein
LSRIEGKNQKSEANSQTPGRPPFYDKYKDYNLIMWQKTTGVMMNRRAKEPRADMPPTQMLRYGERGALEHWRRGLVGAVQDWADGSLANVVMLLVRLVSHFKVHAPASPCFDE